MQNVTLVLLITAAWKCMLSPLRLLRVLFQKTNSQIRHVFSTLSLLPTNYMLVVHTKTEGQH